MTETKPKLRTERVSYIKVDSRDIGKFICEVYGIPYYNPAATQEWSNDSCQIMAVQKEELDAWDLARLEKIKAGDELPYSFRLVMTDLCNQDLIEPGVYLITVCR